MISENMPHKRYSLFVLAVLLFVIACGAFVLAPNNFGIRASGIVALLISVWLVRVSNVHRQQSLRSGTNVESGKGIGPIWWAAGLGCLLAAGGAYLYLSRDALNGYHQVLPVYIFTVVGLACAVVWGCIAVKLLQRALFFHD